MQVLKNNLEATHLQYYVITPRDRARLKTLLAPLPARETEETFKAMMECFFMAKPNNASIINRLKFCAFKNALALVRGTTEQDNDLTPVDPQQARYQRRLEKAKGCLVRYEEALKEYETLASEVPAVDEDPDVTFDGPKGESITQAFRRIDVVASLKRMRLHALAEAHKKIQESIHPCALRQAGIPAAKGLPPFADIVAAYEGAKEELWQNPDYSALRKEIGLTYYGQVKLPAPGIFRQMTRIIIGS